MSDAPTPPEAAYHLLLDPAEVPVTASALRLLISDEAHQPEIRRLAREVLAELEAEPDEFGRPVGGAHAGAAEDHAHRRASPARRPAAGPERRAPGPALDPRQAPRRARDPGDPALASAPAHRRLLELWRWPTSSSTCPPPSASGVRARSAAVAGEYQRGRPSYPRAAIDWVLGEQPLTVLDLGAGTGKLSAAVLAAGHDGDRRRAAGGDARGPAADAATGTDA